MPDTQTSSTLESGDDLPFTFPNRSKSTLLRLKFNEKIILVFCILMIVLTICVSDYFKLIAILLVGVVTMFFCFRTKKYFIRSFEITSSGLVAIEVFKWNKLYLKDTFQIGIVELNIELNTKVRFPEKFIRLKLGKDEFVIHQDAFFKKRHLEALDALFNKDSSEN